MTDLLANAIKRHVDAMLSQMGQTRMAIVDVVDPSTYTAKVRIQPENTLTGWLPIAAHQIGPGWGVVSPPVPGEQVVVLPQEGSSEHGIIIGRIFDQGNQPPDIYNDPRNAGTTNNVQPGEIALVGSDGTFIRIVQGRVLIHGDLYVSGDVFDKNGPLDRLRTEYQNHRHTEVMPGGATTGTTTIPDPETL